MRAKSGHGAEVRALIEEYRGEQRMQTHYIIAEVASKENNPDRKTCENRMAAIKARLLEITTGELDQRIV